MTDSLLANDEPTIDPAKDYVPELVGEGKKFKTLQDLARGKVEADLFIETKNRQFDELSKDYLELRKRYEAVPKLEELVDKLTSQQNTNTNSDHTPAKVDMDKPAYDPEQLDSLLNDKLQKHEASKRQAANLQEVQAKLEERFGKDYKSVLKAQTQNLGLTEDQINDLARTAPKAFFNTLGLNEVRKEDGFLSPPRSERRSDSFAPRTEKRTYSYYQNMRKSDPAAWLSAKTHNQMIEDIKEQGEEAFYRGT